MKNILIAVMMCVMFASVFTSFEYKSKHKEAMLDHIETLKIQKNTLEQYDQLIDKHILLQIEHVKALELLNKLAEEVERNQNTPMI